MSVHLKDRLRQIPGGYKFLVPQTNWQPFPYSSFETIVRGLMAHRRANPFLTRQNKWATDYETVCNEVDRYNALICQAHHWDAFIVNDGGGGDPKASPRGRSLSGVATAAVTGAKIIATMFGSGLAPAELAQARARVCVECPYNDRKGTWESFFTVPASNLARKALGVLNDLELKTESDESLGVCSICLCPLKTKVWAQLSHIAKHLPPEDKVRLPSHCWILTESAKP